MEQKAVAKGLSDLRAEATQQSAIPDNSRLASFLAVLFLPLSKKTTYSCLSVSVVSFLDYYLSIRCSLA